MIFFLKVVQRDGCSVSRVRIFGIRHIISVMLRDGRCISRHVTSTLVARFRFDPLQMQRMEAKSSDECRLDVTCRLMHLPSLNITPGKSALLSH